MQFGKDVQPEQGGLVDDEQRLLFFGTDQGLYLLADEPGEDRPGRRDGVDVEFCQQLAIDLEDGAGGGGDPQGFISGGVELSGRPAQGGGLAGADLAGDQGDAADADDVLHPLADGEEFVGLEDGAGFQIGAERFPGQAEEGSVAHGWPSPKGSIPCSGLSLCTVVLTVRSSGRRRPWERPWWTISTRSGLCS